jgi:hypothetical protein
MAALASLEKWSSGHHLASMGIRQAGDPGSSRMYNDLDHCPRSPARYVGVFGLRNAAQRLKETLMSVEHHDLIHEFPELKGRIHDLKVSNTHFRKLFDEYHALTRNIEKMEDEVTPVATRTEEEHKVRRVHLKDELYRLLTAA